MNPDWQQFLTQQGATLDTGMVQHFGDIAAELRATAQGAVLCDLSQFGTLRACGEDAASFLQNMLSNDIHEVSATRAQFSSLNSPKGRMLASMLIWRDGSDYLLQLPRDLCEPLRKKLSMYVMRAKVKITSATDEIVMLGISGENVQEILRKQFGELPQLPLDFSTSGQAGVLKFSDTRFQVSTAVQHAPALWQALARNAQPVGSVCWDWLNIRAGIPVILPLTQEQFVPQMANFEILGGVNFKKGCYPGQEIVARMQYLGKLKRRMYLVHLNGHGKYAVPDNATCHARFPHPILPPLAGEGGNDSLREFHVNGASPESGEAPLPGDELYSAEMEGQASGMIANVSPAPGGGFDALAVVQTSSIDEALHFKSLQGEIVQFLPQPYPLPQG